MNNHLQNVSSNFEAICRVCLIIKPDMVCINNDTNNMIEACSTSMQQYYPKDKYPQQICTDCSIELKNVYQFQQQIDLSFKVLNNYIITQTNVLTDKFENGIQQYEIKIEIEEEEEKLGVAIKQEIVDEESTHQNIELAEININDDWIKLENLDSDNKISDRNNKNGDNFENTKDTNSMIVKQYKISDFVCNICNSKFINRNRLIKHIKTHIKFKSNDDLHTTDNHQAKFKCDNCLQGFITLSQLISHCEQDHQAIPIKCKQCNLECVNYLQMLKHEQSHSRKYVCEHCGVIFDQLSILESHKLSSHSDKKDRLFVCSICDNSYPTISTLKSHVKTTHATRLESWDICTICRKLVKCVKIHYLKYHGRIKNCNNKSIKVHSCWCCDAKFGSWYALKRHMLKHGVERPFVCKICDKEFRFENILEIHLRIQHCN